MKRQSTHLTAIFTVFLISGISGLTCFSQDDTGRIDLNALAAQGAAIATADPLSAELRLRQTDDSVLRGFDIGMAAAENQTLPGPGKDRLRSSLPLAQQRGFSIAVSF